MYSLSVYVYASTTCDQNIMASEKNKTGSEGLRVNYAEEKETKKEGETDQKG